MQADWLAKRVAFGSSYVGGPPFPANDASLICDIGISALSPHNTWTSLPSGFAYTAGAGSSIDNVIGFVPGSGGNNNGRVAGTNIAPAALGFQGTVYIKLDRRAPSCDYSGSSSTVFYDSNGNPNFAASTFVPTMWQLDNGAGTNIQAWTQGSFNRNNNGAFFPTGNQVVNPALLIPSPNLDPSVMEYVFTWRGTLCHLYIDGCLVYTGNYTGGQLPTGIFTNIGIGNLSGGANTFLGGNLGPYAIQRFQISTAYCPPPFMPGPLVGVLGDSYIVGPAGGDSSGTGAQVHRFAGQFQGEGAYVGQAQWSTLLQSYAYKQLGAYFPIFGCGHSGWSSYYTGYGSPIAKPGATTAWDNLNAQKPEIVIVLDSVNNIYNYPGDGVTTPLSDIQTTLAYLANNNPSLRAIIYMEMLSIELVPQPAAGGSILQPKEASVAAGWRQMLRQALRGYTAGTRNVPVTYLTTHEQWAGSSDGTRMILGSHPLNTATSGAAQGPSGATPNIHPTVEGYVRMADLMWSALLPHLIAGSPT